MLNPKLCQADALEIPIRSVVPRNSLLTAMTTGPEPSPGGALLGGGGGCAPMGVPLLDDVVTDDEPTTVVPVTDAAVLPELDVPPLPTTTWFEQPAAMTSGKRRAKR